MLSQNTIFLIKKLKTKEFLKHWKNKHVYSMFYKRVVLKNNTLEPEDKDNCLLSVDRIIIGENTRNLDKLQKMDRTLLLENLNLEEASEIAKLCKEHRDTIDGAEEDSEFITKIFNKTI